MNTSQETTNDFVLYYPAKPYHLNQSWGVYDPKNYSQFGFTRHNGNDIALGSDKKLYAPFNGVVVRTGNQPQGGGIFFGLMSDVYDWPDGKYRVLLDMLHCEELLVSEGQNVQTSDVLAIADNTGFSTGPHTHLQARRVLDWNGLSGDSLNWTPQDHNDANGSFDLVPYWNGRYACDYKSQITKETIAAEVIPIVAKGIDIVKKLPPKEQPHWLQIFATILKSLGINR